MAESHRAQFVSLHVRVSNTAALRLYRRQERPGLLPSERPDLLPFLGVLTRDRAEARDRRRVPRYQSVRRRLTESRV